MGNLNSLAVENLSVSYRQVEALRNVSFQVLPHRVTGIIGPNGAGKSTMMKAMLGLIPYQFGSILLDNQPLIKQKSRIAYVPQRSQIDWTYPATVWDVVMMGRVKKTGWLLPFSKMSRLTVKKALEKVQMSDFCHRPIGELSGGQQQRVFLARSLAQSADIFFFDEPFAGVDQKTETIIFNIFRELAQEGKIVLVVNHDLGESINNFDNLILVNKNLIASGTKEEVLQEENLYNAYSGKVSFFSQNQKLIA
ncbi:MAG: metal ABC transporter ATP-binding protein [Cyanobacteria bacterium]|nr:metal ABC transporter ATP-binding protein [Cyanobacteria bacterium CG_2015-16_32_12]NCO79102.1 metal ABC transporter ATP-binding protein [Cyanobacteria bacterium CG_2015-22_32_23]NCQ03848.1 metal ABC transporter ATP-binding protein [Cyanobacteria bacterium CG_2015-09_32_10]NCQ40415.1 metal ABC transporter ATP-binding protein [Cyanobacteria bacterium CG_2015-04_32_10]NCS84193.1 metal ABC transporter ATP-binding protein [Cyanobacteria bacterium CG_2015-02_32_10]